MASSRTNGASASASAPGTPVITCAKGIEHGTRKFMTEIIAEMRDIIAYILSLRTEK